MPEIQLLIFSQRGRGLTDAVDDWEVRGTHFVHPADIDPIPGGLLFNLVRGRYTCKLSVEGFKSWFQLALVAERAKTVRATARHRCTLLPRYARLDREQKRLLRSFARAGGNGCPTGKSTAYAEQGSSKKKELRRKLGADA
ncbi:hypothetical protein MYX77_12230 [Acidobacteriia bacterium AH_259_A11_L15]|nr:hypothetical protein [Acidobacteriia bacterium AH_259_A11_L15]